MFGQLPIINHDENAIGEQISMLLKTKLKNRYVLLTVEIGVRLQNPW